MNKKEKKEIKHLIAQLYRFSGCTCCGNEAGKLITLRQLDRILDIGRYPDNSGYNIHQWRRDKFVLNIGMGEGKYSDARKYSDLAAIKNEAESRQINVTFAGWTTGEYTHQNGTKITENTLILEIEAAEIDAEEFTEKLAVRLKEECIALYRPAFDEGKLIPPQPHMEFSKAFFRMP